MVFGGPNGVTDCHGNRHHAINIRKDWS